jgi:hypothetical protein
MTGHRDPPQFGRVLELAVTALLPNLKPAIVLDPLQHVSNFHATAQSLL